MLGRKENLISASDKMNSLKKIMLWVSGVENDDLSIFPSAMHVAAKLKIKQKVQFKKNLVEHLLSLHEGLKKYIPSISTNVIERVISPFGASGEHNINTASDLTYAEKEELIGVSSYTILKSEFQDISLDSFWISLKNDYPAVVNKALDILLPFCTSYLCEAAFSTLKTIKSKNRLKLLDVDSETRVSSSTIRPRIEKLRELHQSQISH
jgi:hypothetical protein